ncbi:MAG: hypothetical protein IT257_05110 [Chitinophagaceae bacterium]|nr:hypothetical protein [Chitinophagaceae bacterium]
MKSKKLQFIYVLCFCTVAAFLFSSNSGGITGKSQSGCGPAGGCHNGSQNTTMTVTGIPGAGFVAGTTYPLTLTITNASKIRAGFNLTVDIGTLAAGAGMALNGTQELRHTTPKAAAANNTTWTFDWTAPAAGSTLNVFVAGNAVDFTGGSNNDEFDTDAFTFNAAAAALSPTVTSVTATSITTSGATVNAQINANNSNTGAIIEYGTTVSYGSTANMTPNPVTGNTAVAATGNITGLNAGTLYHYRVKATNANGITSSADATFTTLVPANINSIEKTGIELFPNPVADFLFYKNKESQSDVRFVIMGVNGTTQAVNIEKLANGHYKLQTTALAAGNYVLVMELDGKKYYHHFAK